MVRGWTLHGRRHKRTGTEASNPQGQKVNCGCRGLDVCFGGSQCGDEKVLEWDGVEGCEAV